MVKGDMCLKVVEKGVHKDVPIKEGEVIYHQLGWLFYRWECLYICTSTVNWLLFGSFNFSQLFVSTRLCKF